jgi:hypothetical protein
VCPKVSVSVCVCFSAVLCHSGIGYEPWRASSFVFCLVDLSRCLSVLEKFGATLHCCFSDLTDLSAQTNPDQQSCCYQGPHQQIVSINTCTWVQARGFDHGLAHQHLMVAATVHVMMMLLALLATTHTATNKMPSFGCKPPTIK